MPDQENIANEVTKWFSDVWAPELLLPPEIIRMFGPKTAFLSQNMLSWAHIGLAGSFGAQLVGGCCAGCILHDTYLPYGIHGFALFCATLFMVQLKWKRCKGRFPKMAWKGANDIEVIDNPPPKDSWQPSPGPQRKLLSLPSIESCALWFSCER